MTAIDDFMSRVRRSGRLRRIYRDVGAIFEAPPGPPPPADLDERRKRAKKIHVGCGPKNIFPGWYNVDIRWFAGMDEALDVTKGWPFENVERVYTEHFLEHLSLEDSVEFLARAGNSLVEGGKIRLSTPNLHWVWLTHFRTGDLGIEPRVDDTLKSNRAFHGWGHQFLWSEEMLRFVLGELGFVDVRFYGYGKSDDPTLVDLERHGGYSIEGGQPSVVIVEASKSKAPIAISESLRTKLETDYHRYVDSGH
jgi:hypothetical protein